MKMLLPLFVIESIHHELNNIKSKQNWKPVLF